MPDPATTTQLHKEVRLHFAAILYFLSRIAVVAFVFAVPALYFLRGYAEVPLVAGGAGLVAALFIGYYAVASGLRCPACASEVLLDNGNVKHLHARRFPGLNQRARVAWDILSGSTYQCMYCLSKCRCKRSRGTPRALEVEGVLREQAPAGTFPGSVFEDVLKGGEPADPDFNPFGEPGADPELQLQAALRPRQTVSFPDPTPAIFPEIKFPEAFVPEGETAEHEHSPFSITRKSSQPVPWTVLDQPATTADAPIMNRPSHDSQPVHGPNPFLAAAAAMGPPPSPILPYLPGMQDRPEDQFPPDVPFPSRQEFSQPPEAGGAPLWTLPSLPVTAEADSPRPVPVRSASPSIPDFPHSVPMPEAFSSPAMAAGGSRSTPEDAIREALSDLQDGYRAVQTLFQGVIEKLESRLAAPPPVFQAPAMVALPAIPAPVAALPLAKTTPLPSLPPFPPAPPAPVSKTESPPPGVPRRKFARPSGTEAQQLSSALHEVFENRSAAPTPAAPHSSNGPAWFPGANGQQPVGDSLPTLPPMGAPEPSCPPPPARGMTPPSPFHIVPGGAFPVPATTQFPQTVAPAASDSPFAMADNPQSASAGESSPPAPFTFLHGNGDHFTPIASPGPAYDPLDDTPLPWMQPVIN